MQFWTITDTASGAVLQRCVATAGPEYLPEAERDRFDAATMTAHPIAGPFDPAATTWDGSAWVPCMASLRAMRWTAAKARRDAAQTNGCATPSGTAQTDVDSQRLILGAAAMAMIQQSAGQPYSVEFTLLDNSTVTLDGPAMMAVGVAVGAHVAACHAHSVDLRTAIEAAADPATLAAVDIDTGWPA